MSRNVPTEGPTHLVAEPGDRFALCGKKKPMPRLWAQAASKHAYDHPRCPACYTAAGLERMLPPPGTLW